MSMGFWAEGLACTDPGARTPIGVSGNYLSSPVVTLRADQELREILNQVQFAVKLPLLIDDILNCLILSIYQDGNLKLLVPWFSEFRNSDRSRIKLPYEINSYRLQNKLYILHTIYLSKNSNWNLYINKRLLFYFAQSNEI